ncbi:MAG: hypothetical protein NTW48_06555 [Chloroflexi bacterium]|nr:hypothetical protein [Chloroflexota bacterium]
MPKKDLVLWILGTVLFFIALGSEVNYFLQAWNITGGILATIFFPLGIIVYPFIIIVKGLGSWLDIVIHFIIVATMLTLLIMAKTLTDNQSTIFPPKANLRIRSTAVILQIRRFFIWALLQWSEFIGFFIFCILLSPIFVLFGPLRQLLFTISLRSKIWSKDYRGLFNVILFFFYLQLAIAIPTIAYQYFGKDGLLEGIVIAGFLVTFMALQFQKMTPPYFFAAFLDPSNPNEDEVLPKFRIKVSSQAPLFIRITNLGITTLKDCTLKLVFPEGFKIVEDCDLYHKIDFPKNFSVRQNKPCVDFLPKDNYLTFTPCTHLVFPIIVTTPSAKGKYIINVTLSSESAWGEDTQPLIVDVVDT